ncbi:hypothetical protein [Pseudonocardia cypriaca]|uniref:Uncharacterized protein n=1 Tax=Pseudonocardia cypriaca TaxID=882449 RepID=A0A543FT88_9PSEU|nr:hypothetical protein [Pseudonocardia cypriaca]TQM37032.1 hypothetical protein FB388_4233 [Pseudonocardia cypriaca]
MTDHLTTLYSGFSERLPRTPDMAIDAMRDLRGRAHGRHVLQAVLGPFDRSRAPRS